MFIKEQYKLIIVIGLPCSGKTTICQQYFKNYIIHDDFISNFYNNQLIDDLKDNKKIVITDPRLCDIDRFIQYLLIFLKYVKKNQILLILLPNQIKKSLERCLLYKKNNYLENSIIYFSKIYNPSSYLSQNIDIYILNKQ